MLGWRAETNFNDLVALMLDHDLREAGVEIPSLLREATS
jgi:GDP-D-mannose dehydratase